MMDRTRKIRLISNSFYNAGLERAKRRDLTGAVEYLKKCLNLNKYHIDARNLLGLIYYEMGEVSEALVQWVISMNLRNRITGLIIFRPDSAQTGSSGSGERDDSEI